jgi:hypothetical protein
MRVQQPVHYKQIAEALQPGACPLCAFLRDFQAACVRESDTREFEALCNFHTWALAGAAKAESAAKVFLRLLEKVSLDGPALSATPCAICQRIRGEESKRLGEFVERFANEKFREWMSLRGAVCLPHAAKLLPRLSRELGRDLTEILVRRTEELKVELEKLLADTKSGHRGHEGILGRVAEILTAQRGLETK